MGTHLEKDEHLLFGIAAAKKGISKSALLRDLARRAIGLEPLHKPARKRKTKAA